MAQIDNERWYRVSILSAQLRTEQLAKLCLLGMLMRGFNPLRPIKDGATRGRFDSAPTLMVSILSAQLRTEQPGN